MDKAEFISQDVAEFVLLRFGITKASSQYERWLTDGGFYLKNFDDVLFRSSHITSFDWREATDQIGLQIVRLFRCCDLRMDWTLDEVNKGTLESVSAKTVIKYEPNTDDINYTVSDLMFKHLHDEVVAFSGKHNSDGDTATFALLKKKDADRLYKKHPEVLSYFFDIIDAQPKLPKRGQPEKRSFIKIIRDWFTPSRS